MLRPRNVAPPASEADRPNVAFGSRASPSAIDGRASTSGMPVRDRGPVAVQYIAKGQFRTHAPQRVRSLFNHLIGTGDQGRRDFKAQRPSGVHIDDQLKRCRELDRKVSRFGTFQYIVNISCGASTHSSDHRIGASRPVHTRVASRESVCLPLVRKPRSASGSGTSTGWKGLAPHLLSASPFLRTLHQCHRGL
jgi:hypothetical protein